MAPLGRLEAVEAIRGAFYAGTVLAQDMHLTVGHEGNLLDVSYV